MANAGARAYKGVSGLSPRWGISTEHTFLRCVLKLVGLVVADLTERNDQTHAYIRCYFECKRQNGSGVSHLEVLCDFLQVQSHDRCVLVLCSLTYSELI